MKLDKIAREVSTSRPRPWEEREFASNPTEETARERRRTEEVESLDLELQALKKSFEPR